MELFNNFYYIKRMLGNIVDWKKTITHFINDSDDEISPAPSPHAVLARNSKNFQIYRTEDTCEYDLVIEVLLSSMGLKSKYFLFLVPKKSGYYKLSELNGACARFAIMCNEMAVKTLPYKPFSNMAEDYKIFATINKKLGVISGTDHFNQLHQCLKLIVPCVERIEEITEDATREYNLRLDDKVWAIEFKDDTFTLTSSEGKKIFPYLRSCEDNPMEVETVLESTSVYNYKQLKDIKVLSLEGEDHYIQFFILVNGFVQTITLPLDILKFEQIESVFNEYK